MRVKVCGITILDDARAALDAGAAALGFNFYPHSPRFVRPEAAAAIIAQLPSTTCSIGVFVNASRPEVIRIAAQTGVTALQFHGGETPDFCVGWPLKVIKSIRVRDRQAADDALRYPVDFILADAHVEGRFGGTGTRIAAELLEGFDRQRLILAGGLTPDNVAEAIRSVRPFAVDVASGIEREPGRKDWESMRRFVNHAHAA
ncbi:MAG: phosphoribosylanthranilate isomerase [Candidatus Binatia bacterium]